MEENPGKFHLLLSTQEEANIQLANTTIESLRSQKLLGIINICQKVNRKLNALARLTIYMKLPERRILMNPLFKAQFNYCLILWMIHSLSMNNKINRLHERCLSIIYNDKCSNFEELLVKDTLVSIYHNDIYSLANEMYKVVNGISPEIMNNVFEIRNYTLDMILHFLLNLLILFLMVVNQHRFWNPKHGKKDLMISKR